MGQTPAKKIRTQVKLPRPPGEVPTYVWLNDKTEIMIVKCGSKTRIFSSLCPHMGAQMQFCSKSRTVHCPWHGLRYDADSRKSDHHRYKKLQELKGEVVDDNLLIYE